MGRVHREQPHLLENLLNRGSDGLMDDMMGDGMTGGEGASGGDSMADNLVVKATMAGIVATGVKRAVQKRGLLGKAPVSKAPFGQPAILLNHQTAPASSLSTPYRPRPLRPGLSLARPIGQYIGVWSERGAWNEGDESAGSGSLWP